MITNEQILEHLLTKMPWIPNDYFQHFTDGVKFAEEFLEFLNTQISPKMQEYAKFCVECDREGIPLLKYEDYLKL
jgi:hypothetical protein